MYLTGHRLPVLKLPEPQSIPQDLLSQNFPGPRCRLANFSEGDNFA